MEIAKTHVAKLNIADLENLVSKETGYKAKIKSVTIDESGDVDRGTYKKEISSIEFNLIDKEK